LSPAANDLQRPSERILLRPTRRKQHPNCRQRVADFLRVLVGDFNKTRPSDVQTGPGFDRTTPRNDRTAEPISEFAEWIAKPR
jgi:hypothetical protein